MMPRSGLAGWRTSLKKQNFPNINKTVVNVGKEMGIPEHFLSLSWTSESSSIDSAPMNAYTRTYIARLIFLADKREFWARKATPLPRLSGPANGPGKENSHFGGNFRKELVPFLLLLTGKRKIETFLFHI